MEYILTCKLAIFVFFYQKNILFVEALHYLHWELDILLENKIKINLYRSDSFQVQKATIKLLYTN